VTTKRQIEANRRNAKKGGPRTETGKAVSRLNARKHGIFASALTQEDHDELGTVHEQLCAWYRPAGPVEGMLVEKLAQTYLRLQRCARAEAEYHIRTWERPLTDHFRIREEVQRRSLNMYVSNFSRADFQRSVELFARYDTTLTNQMIKLIHEIERLQRLRLGERVPPPLAADVTVHRDAPAPEHVNAELILDGEVLPADRNDEMAEAAEGC